ncbi:MFS transporter [Pontixanthobacter sp. CEM42]|uniref:MFS transporter n=1 Tax=Pontixanthobacter sp. CEM42 TaxID=2792077 RepID=UPI001AE0E72D|nr:MFS transporter [Pontixanthobacter sp. CEM42]
MTALSGHTPLPQRIKLFHGFGAVAFGIKDNGFSVFLLIFYNQVLGMDAALVSLALALALIIDAFIDPLLGNLSDRTYTRWGRRLPWLYAAPLPLAIAWVVMWQPPIGGEPTFFGLLGLAVVVRLLLSACEVPSTSLVPELTSDYDERTTLFRYRFLSGWTGGLIMLFLAYQVFLAGRLLEPEGYAIYGYFGAAVIFISVIGSALGQHSRVARLPKDKPPPFKLRVAFSEIIQALSERSFLILAGGALGAYVSQGMTFALSNYLYLYIWQFSEAVFAFYPIVLFLSVVLTFITLGPAHKKWGKPKVAAVATLISMVIYLIPYGFYWAGLWPEIGSTMSSALVLGFLLLSNTFGVMVMISASSMVAEIVEAFEERTERRAEGSFYSGYWFIQKCATGIGIFLTGLIVAIAGLPEQAVPGEVAEPVIDSMILQYCIAIVVLGVVSAWFMNRFPIDRAEHEARVAALAAKTVFGDVDDTPANS